jgi:transposase-like protein
MRDQNDSRTTIGVSKLNFGGSKNDLSGQGYWRSREMSRACTICGNPKRGEMDAALVSNESIRAIAKRFGVTTSALQRHRRKHVPATLAKAAEIAEVIHAETLLDRLKALNRETASILREVRSDGAKDNELALKAIARAEKQIELEGRLLGELNEGSTVNVVLTPEWSAIRAAILSALQPYPEARLAVTGALQNVGT